MLNTKPKTNGKDDYIGQIYPVEKGKDFTLNNVHYIK